jgi:hypothetical protein
MAEGEGLHAKAITGAARLSEDINAIGGVTRTFLAGIRNLTMGYRISVRHQPRPSF